MPCITYSHVYRLKLLERLWMSYYLWVMDVSYRGGWTLSGAPLSLDDPRILSITEAERQFLDTEYDEYAASSSSGAPFFRSAALIVSL